MGLLACALAAFVASTEGRIEYDDATYLTRGLFHAAQVQERGNLLLPRLAWSLTFESPKPPLFHGLLATAALLLGREHLTALIVAGTLVPLLSLLATIFLLARHTAGWAPAGFFGVAAYLAMASSLDLGTRLFVETTLAATVVGGAYFAYRRARGGSLVDEVGLGVCAGLGLLTKLLGPLFLAPVALVALAICWQREGVRPVLRFALVSGLIATAVAACWYARNWRQAVEFAFYVRTHEISLFVGPAWRRPLDFIGGSLGWPMASLVAVAAAYRAGRAPRDPGASLLGWMALAAAAVSAAVIATQPMFDPRFWLPAQALVAGWLGVEVGGLWRRVEGAARRWLVVAAAVALVAFAAQRVAAKPRPQMPWQAATAVAHLVAAKDAPTRFCTLGNNPDWNLYKLQLLAELSARRPRPQTSDLLIDGRAAGFERRLAACDVVFALPVERVPNAPNQRAYNAELAAGWQLLALHAGELRPAPAAAAAALGSRAQPQLFVRRPSS